MVAGLPEVFGSSAFCVCSDEVGIVSEIWTVRSAGRLVETSTSEKAVVDLPSVGFSRISASGQSPN